MTPEYDGTNQFCPKQLKLPRSHHDIIALCLMSLTTRQVQSNILCMSVSLVVVIPYYKTTIDQILLCLDSVR